MTVCLWRTHQTPCFGPPCLLPRGAVHGLQLFSSLTLVARRHPSELGAVSHCKFGLYFPKYLITDVGYLLRCLLVICIFSLENCQFKVFCPFVKPGLSFYWSAMGVQCFVCFYVLFCFRLYVFQAGLELTILLPELAWWWNYRHVPSYPVLQEYSIYSRGSAHQMCNL